MSAAIHKPYKLLDLICLNKLVSLMPIRTVRAGLIYFRQGKVLRLKLEGDRAMASVEGTSTYDCLLDVFTGRLRGVCVCPAYSRQGNCKHIAAVGFALIDHKGSSLKDTTSGEAHISMSRVHAHLEGLTKNQLQELILDEALENPLFLADLRHSAARKAKRKKR